MIVGMSAMTIQLPQRRKVPHDTFGSRLVLLRHDLGLTQQQIADLVGVGRAAWNTWENGSIPRSQADIARKITDATGYDLKWLLYGFERPSPDDHSTGRFRVRVTAQERNHPNVVFRPLQRVA